MLLGIEIGGTKLQLGVGCGDGKLVALERRTVDRARGALAILEQIECVGRELAARHRLAAAGIGFGGPVDVEHGRTITSHQVEGWNNFPIVEWLQFKLGLFAALGNDADVAALAEARDGAGRGRNPVFYITVGTGIGGGLVIDGEIYRGSGAGAAEIGHLRPGLEAGDAHHTVESIAAGPGIAAAANRSLKPRSDGALWTAELVGQAAAAGDAAAVEVLNHAWQALGWAIAQVLTLVSPGVVVIGGGVSLLGERLFFEPLRAAVDRYVFPPLRGKYTIVPAALGEEMVIHGALHLAASLAPRVAP
ncbi:MAG TPA: ROK family protein [Pirellulales bacterium]|jgi:glucokinase|nr:ROK family protein [Pirellulales bacterium]